MAGRAQQCDLGIEDDMHRYRGHQIGETPFALKGLLKASILQSRQDARRDAAAQVDAAGGHHLEGQVPRLRPQDGDEGVERGDAEFARPFSIQRGVDDDRGGIVGRSQLLGQPARFLGVAAVLEIGVDVGQPPTRADPLVADVLEALQEIVQQFKFKVISRRKIGMAALRGMGPVA